MKAVSLTTVNDPRWQLLDACVALGYEVFVAGDATTPNSWEGVRHSSIHYLSVKEQRRRWPALSALTPLGHYARKNFAHLAAVEAGADHVWELDDDNYPTSDPVEVLRKCLRMGLTEYDAEFVNVYRFWYPDRRLWPRGYPLTRVRESIEEGPMTADSLQPLAADASIDCVQFLVDGEPDVDAICRLVSTEYGGSLATLIAPVVVAISDSSRCPANTQNTLWPRSSKLDYLYHPHSVSMRYSDILKMYVAQQELRVAYGPATVRQLRNKHSILADLIDELPMYRDSEHLFSALGGRVVGGGVRCAEYLEVLHRGGLLAQSDVDAALVFQELIDEAL